MRLAANYHDIESVDPADATAAAIAEMLRGSRRSSPLLESRNDATRIDRLVRSGARIDAVLAVIALELPQWQLRRIAYDGGEWHCALSRNRDLADWLDQSAEGRHADLALSVLTAAVEAQHIAASSPRPSSLPRLSDRACIPLCCDNFS